jgi:hypothetical protein
MFADILLIFCTFPIQGNIEGYSPVGTTNVGFGKKKEGLSRFGR